jgi:YidC/Oxa1 family membrane protein insertase
MDLQRKIIFVGLAIVSYLMIRAWNQDYYVNPKNDVTSSQTQIQEKSGSNDQFDSLPAKSASAPKTSTDEFTTPEQANKHKDNSFSASTNQNTATHFIHVKTDVLDITIDLTGGNVVESLLSQYKLHKNSKELLPILESSSQRHYVAESGLYGKDGFDSSKNGPTPVYSTTKQDYVLTQSENSMNVDLHYQSKDGIDLIKRYTFERNRYLVNVSYIIKNNSTKPWSANFSAKLKRDESGDPSQQSSMGMHSFLGMVLSQKSDPYQKFTFKKLKEKPISEDITGGWIAFIQHYFLSAWIPNSNIDHRYQTLYRNGEFLMGFTSPEMTVQPGQQKEVSAKLYTGPKIISRLEKAAPKLDLTVDYGWLFFIAFPLFKILQFFHHLVGNWGISIIMVTVLVKGLFFKLSEKSYKSMANMRRVGPQLQRLKELYGDDRQKMSQAMMDLYKKEKINPLGGCLPVLVQMPVFISLYWVLLESVQLRQSPFFFWITDLSVKDPYFILPILMGASMFIQMQLNPTPPDPMQAKIMKIMPVMFSIFFLWFPAGLVLYWLVNNILSISQQYVITKGIEKEAAQRQ